VSSNELTSFELFVQPYPWVTEPIWRRRTDGGGRGVRGRGFTGETGFAGEIGRGRRCVGGNRRHGGGEQRRVVVLARR
jgi:hypothetical protein